jgi:hypothetical protein
MRTTLDLPDDLLRRAKIAAVERGTTWRELVGVALERELAATHSQAPRRTRTRFPAFSSPAPAALDLTNADIARLEAEEDRRRHVGADRRQRARRADA